MRRPLRRWLVALIAFVSMAAPARAAEPVTVDVESTLDGTTQPARWLAPQVERPAPLLVWLHSWSADYTQQDTADDVLAEAARRGWAFLMPNFRGPNTNPEACGSPLARQDILDAVAFAKAHSTIDADRVYLAGASGGGHMGLVMAGEAPELWAAVAVSVPITDLAAWYAFHTRNHEVGRYAKHLEAVTGGPPSAPRFEQLARQGERAKVDAQYRARSPLASLHRAAGLPIRIEAGIEDGHRGSVPIDHALRAFNALALANDASGRAIPLPWIDAATPDARVPSGLDASDTDTAARTRRALVARTAGPAELVLFDGAHDTDVPALVAFLETKRRQPLIAGDTPKRLLILGDSNAASDRAWPRRLASMHEHWSIANPSLPGATIGFDNNNDPRLNTLARLGAIAQANPGPFDAIIIALGTNDAKAIFAGRQSEVPANATALIRRAKRIPGWGVPRIFLLLPPPVTEPDNPSAKYAGAPARLNAFRADLARIARGLDAEIIDPTPLFEPDPARLLEDGVHVTDEGHDLLARAIEAALRRPR